MRLSRRTLLKGAGALPLAAGRSDTQAKVTANAGRHYLRLEVRDHDGATELISSPLYINFPEE